MAQIKFNHENYLSLFAYVTAEVLKYNDMYLVKIYDAGCYDFNKLLSMKNYIDNKKEN